MTIERIRVNVDADGAIHWQRGGDGMSVKGFVDGHSCKALDYLAGGGMSTQLGEAILSTMGGRGKLQWFNREHDCGVEENLIQQI
jgi:hypothetical protein